MYEMLQNQALHDPYFLSLRLSVIVRTQMTTMVTAMHTR